MNRATKLAIGSVVVAIAVLGLKAVAWWLTGSVALLADALESIVNVAAAAAALAAISFSARPADTNHPYGHAKAEYFSAVLEGALIIVAAMLILHHAWGAFLAPRAPEQATLGLAISAELVKGHGGRLELLKSDEEGTDFLIRLPKQTDPVQIA